MVEVYRSSGFDHWLRNLRDNKALARILVRINRLIQGNPGDSRPVGQGVQELRIAYGPGYRVYYLWQGSQLVLLLCGGDKSSQNRDIRQAYQLANEWKRRNNE